MCWRPPASPTVKHPFALGLAAAAIATASWGIQLPLAKDAFASVDPFHITSLRYLVASLFLLAALIWREGWHSLSYRGSALSASALGVIGMCGSPMLVFLGMSMSSAEHAVVIVALQPAIAALAFWLLRGRRPPNFTLACIAVAFFGVVLVVTRGQLTFIESPRQMLGDFICLLGAACWVAYTLGVGRFAGWSIWRITTLTMVPGALATALLTAVLVALGYLSTPSLGQLATVGWEIAYLTFVGVLFSLLAWNFGTRHIGPMNATLLINCMPVTTFIYRAAQGYRVAPIEVAGAGLVVVALIANNLRLRSLQLHAARLAAS